MGICKFQDIWKTLFSWVLPVPENAHKAKCKYCPGKLIDIKCGSQAVMIKEAHMNKAHMIKEFPFVKAVVNFVENLSNFVENKPKVRSILKESSAFLGISRLPDYAETRFLNLYLVIEAIVTQYANENWKRWKVV